MRARLTIVPLLVSYATGTLLGASLLSLLPHIVEDIRPLSAFGTVLLGILALFVVEKPVLLHQHHHHHAGDRHVAAGPLILIGDAFHNFVDGISIAAAFLASVPLGIATGVAVVSHEVPQEVGDFAILLESGYSRSKAFLYNLISGLMTLPGALAGYSLLQSIQAAIPYILAVAASSFLYISMADLVPHLHERPDRYAAIWQFILICLGVGTILLVERFLHP